jgi:rare lipoprotein A
LLGACAADGTSRRDVTTSLLPFAAADTSVTVIPKNPLRASEDRIALADLMPISTAGTAVASAAARGQLLEPEGTGYDHVGTASWYGGQFHGRRTADGELFDRGELTAAHLTLPLP